MQSRRGAIPFELLQMFVRVRAVSVLKVDWSKRYQLKLLKPIVSGSSYRIVDHNRTSFVPSMTDIIVTIKSHYNYNEIMVSMEMSVASNFIPW